MSNFKVIFYKDNLDKEDGPIEKFLNKSQKTPSREIKTMFRRFKALQFDK